MKRRIVVTHRRDGTHHWPLAPKDELHAHLMDEHRHLFHFRAEVEVRDPDRETTFEHAQRQLRLTIEDTFAAHSPHAPIAFGAISCETIAERILRCCDLFDAVEVWEDGENGARCER